MEEREKGGQQDDMQKKPSQGSDPDRMKQDPQQDQGNKGEQGQPDRERKSA